MPGIGQGATALVTDPDAACALKLQDRFNFWLGEWFLDTRQGFPWLQILGKKNPSLVAARQLFRQTVLSTPPVISVDDVSLTFVAPARDLKYSFQARTQSGATIVGGEGVPFIVKAPAGNG